MDVVHLDGRDYHIEMRQPISSPKEVTRIIIPTYMPNKMAQQIAQVCVESIHKFTTIPYELWVVDNNSPAEFSNWLTQDHKINVILNKTEPVPPLALQKINRKWFSFWLLRRLQKVGQQFAAGSYANAIGLTLATTHILPETEAILALHMDCLALKSGWLNYLRAKLNGNVKAVACRQDDTRVKALHISGLLFDFAVFKALDINFYPNTYQERDKNYEAYDVGDLITLRLAEHNFDTYLCRNTYNSPESVDLIPPNHPLKDWEADRCFDDDEDLFFVHLGRGTTKSIAQNGSSEDRSPAAWFKFAKEYVL